MKSELDFMFTKINLELSLLNSGINKCGYTVCERDGYHFTMRTVGAFNYKLTKEIIEGYMEMRDVLQSIPELKNRRSLELGLTDGKLDFHYLANVDSEEIYQRLPQSLPQLEGICSSHSTMEEFKRLQLNFSSAFNQVILDIYKK